MGIACEDIVATRDWVLRSHDVQRESGVIWDELQQANLCLLEVGGIALELVAGPVVAGLLRRGQLLYHVCYEVPDLEITLAELVGDACRVVSPPKPAVLFDGRRVAFVLGPTGLIELLEQRCGSQ